MQLRLFLSLIFFLLLILFVSSAVYADQAEPQSETASDPGFKLILNSVLFQPPLPGYSDIPAFIKIKSTQGRQIRAVYLKNPRARYTLLYSHGNAEDLGHIIPTLREYRKNGFAVFAYDYQGYGRSEGTPDEKNCYDDIACVYQAMINDYGIRPDSIIIYGRSVGSGPSVRLAACTRPAGLILEGAFMSALSVVIDNPPREGDAFVNVDRISRINCPVLIVHAQRDEVVPISHAHKLFEMAPPAKMKFFVKNAGHNNLLSAAGRECFRVMKIFARRLETNYFSPRQALDGIDPKKQKGLYRTVNGKKRFFPDLFGPVDLPEYVVACVENSFEKDCGNVIIKYRLRAEASADMKTILSRISSNLTAKDWQEAETAPDIFRIDHDFVMMGTERRFYSKQDENSPATLSQAIYVSPDAAIIWQVINVNNP